MSLVQIWEKEKKSNFSEKPRALKTAVATLLPLLIQLHVQCVQAVGWKVENTT